MSAFIPCPCRVVIDGKLVAYKGMPITEEQAEEFGLALIGEPEDQDEEFSEPSLPGEESGKLCEDYQDGAIPPEINEIVERMKAEQTGGAE